MAGGVTTEVHGPIFDVRAERYADNLLTEAKQEIGDLALWRWQMNLEGSLQNPTGRYQSELHTVKRDQDVVVNDGWGETNMLPYGPWLEGVGSRNAPVTRFPGYFALRRAAAWTRTQVASYVAPIAEKWTRRMNDG